MEEYFKALEIPAYSSFTDVQRSYKELIQVWHPDRFDGREELRRRAVRKTQEINQAYASLKCYFRELSPSTGAFTPATSAAYALEALEKQTDDMLDAVMRDLQADHIPNSLIAGPPIRSGLLNAVVLLEAALFPVSWLCNACVYMVTERPLIAGIGGAVLYLMLEQ